MEKGKHKHFYALYQRGAVWHARFSFLDETGERIQFRETTKRADRNEAEEYCIKRIAGYKKKKGGLNDMSLDEALGRFFEDKKGEVSDPGSLFSRLNTLKKHLGNIMLSEISPKVINEYVEKRKKTVKGATYNRELTDLSSILNTARNLWEKNAPAITMAALKGREEDPTTDYFETLEQVDLLVENAPEHLKNIIYGALYTGFRRSNLIGKKGLRWDNIDFANKIITVKVKDRTRLGGRNHTIPLLKKFEDLLATMPKVSEYVFTLNGKPINSIKTAWRRAFYKRAGTGKKNHLGQEITRLVQIKGLRYIKFHGLRHTVGMWLYRETGDIKIVKEILGHANIKTTERYAKAFDKDKEIAMKKVFG